MNKPIKVEELNVEEVVLGKYKKYLNLSINKKRVYLRLKNVVCPFGVSDFNGNKDYSFQVSINKTIKEKLDKLQESLIKQCISNKDIKKDIKLKKITEETLSLNFNDMYKESEKYDPLMKMKFNKDWDNKDNIKVSFIEEKQVIKNMNTEELINKIGRMNKLDIVFTPSFYIISGKTLGVSMKVFAIKVSKRKDNTITKTQCLIEDSETEEEEVVESSSEEEEEQ